MAKAMNSENIGLKQGKALANLTSSKQLDLIAEGLPVLMNSARELLEASRLLNGKDRAANILEGLAIEEIAKILILIDIVRCPSKIRSSRIGPMMSWFYDHLARLIYFEAQTWKPVNGKQLQEYVNGHRESHYLEGEYGELIAPNWSLWLSESTLYVDLMSDENGELSWNEPISIPQLFDDFTPCPWRVCQSLSKFGAFSRKGLEIVSSVWGKVNFDADQNWSEARNLTHEMLSKLNAAHLFTVDAADDDVSNLHRFWQMPMYNIDFKKINVSIKNLQAVRDANILSEFGL